MILGVLVFVFGTIMAMSAWTVIDVKFATASAAREAVRAAVEADVGADLLGAGRQAAVEALGAHGVSSGDATILQLAGSQRRCAPITFEVALEVPLLRVPALGGRLARVTVSSTYTEVVDPYRSGLVAGVDCAF